MNSLSDNELLQYIREDLPYFDLTTHLLCSEFSPARLEIITRDTIVVACIEEAARIAQLLGAKVLFAATSSSKLQSGETLLTLSAKGDILHQAWKLCQVFLEYSCGMATYANTMLHEAKSVNPKCEIFVTRKSIPFTKRFAIRALLSGGILPHRLGLSETILVFSHHRALFQDKESFENAFLQMKEKAVEKKIIVECKFFEDAIEMLTLGADVIQMDKSDVQTLHQIVAYRTKHFPHAKILATGGVHIHNVKEFARTGVDAIVTSSPYQAKMADIGTKWSNL